MEASDGDLHMLDEPPEQYLQSQFPSFQADSDQKRENRPSVSSDKSSLPSTIQSHPMVANGAQSRIRHATPLSDSDGLLSPVRRLKSPSREPREGSILANDVTARLSIDQRPVSTTRSGPNMDSPAPQSFGLARALSDSLRDDINAYDEEMAAEAEEHEPLSVFRSILPTGYCYDVRMRYHCELEPPKERRELHPEDPRRIFKIYQELCMNGLIDNPYLNKSAPLIPNPLHQVMVREVTEAEAELVHDKKMWDAMQGLKLKTDQELIEYGNSQDSIYLNRMSFGAASLAAGGAIETCRAVLAGQIKNAIAIIRPPGHHAECNRPMGFCIFDNVSIAAKVCQKDWPVECRKILILDWDVHHGNGIQQAFYQDPSVLYISIHVHEDGNFYPSGPYGNHKHCGGSAGEGFNVNVPWSTKGMGDADYMFAFQNIIMPIAREFDPDLVIIAAGFDAADGDELGMCHVSPAGYAQMTHQLMSLADGKLIVCLEGGYNLRSISKSALAVTRTLIGEMPPRLPHAQPTKSGADTVRKVALQQSKYWSSVFPKENSVSALQAAGAERLHDVVREAEAAKMFKAHQMFPLPIIQEKLSKSFENQVIATLDWEGTKPLIVILHDQPEMVLAADEDFHKPTLHNAFIGDGLMHYIDWAVGRGFAVIDANVPEYLTDPDEDVSYVERDGKKRLSAIHHLAEYLWDNYIDLSDASSIVFIGVGTAYQGIVHLLNNRTREFTERVVALVNFIHGPILPASDQVLYDNPKWYRGSSFNLVRHDHAAFLPDQKKKSTKKYGNIVQSEKNGLNDMLMEHREDVQGWIVGKIELRS